MKPALPVLVGLSNDVPGPHQVDPAKVQKGKDRDRGYALCGAFCGYCYEGVILEGDVFCERCLELAGAIAKPSQGRLFG